jgi:hypothetical protein
VNVAFALVYKERVFKKSSKRNENRNIRITLLLLCRRLDATPIKSVEQNKKTTIFAIVGSGLHPPPSRQSTQCLSSLCVTGRGLANIPCTMYKKLGWGGGGANSNGAEAKR